jgi:hypothetical protein
VDRNQVRIFEALKYSLVYKIKPTQYSKLVLKRQLIFGGDFPDDELGRRSQGCLLSDHTQYVAFHSIAFSCGCTIHFYDVASSPARIYSHVRRSYGTKRWSFCAFFLRRLAMRSSTLPLLPLLVISSYLRTRMQACQNHNAGVSVTA